eukprot:m.357968 g.357968  ORF g.357968 m.357968 type:complete len:179 (-) comp18000_c0_seq1:376-912(-)
MSVLRTSISQRMPSVAFVARGLRWQSSEVPTVQPGKAALFGVQQISKCGNFKITNYNPRSDELEKTKDKMLGFSTSKSTYNFFHKLQLNQSNRHTTVQVDRPGGEQVLVATTKEYNVERFLYSGTDRTAVREMAKLIARRLKECGIPGVTWDRKQSAYANKTKLFVDTIQNQGIQLQE